jgi:hypothetical protein
MSKKILVALSLIGLAAGGTACTGVFSTAAAESRETMPAQEIHPQSEAPLRAAIEALLRGNPDFSQMEPDLQQATRQQLPAVAALLKQLGALKNPTFLVKQNDSDIYKAEFQNGAAMWAIRVSENGKIAGLRFRPI